MHLHEAAPRAGQCTPALILLYPSPFGSWILGLGTFVEGVLTHQPTVGQSVSVRVSEMTLIEHVGERHFCIATSTAYISDFGTGTEEELRYWLAGLQAHLGSEIEGDEMASTLGTWTEARRGDTPPEDAGILPGTPPEDSDTPGPGASPELVARALAFSCSLLEGPNAIRASISNSGIAPLTRPRTLTGDI